MPLVESGAKEAVGENIRREREAGKPERQAIAIALNVQREAQHAHHDPEHKEAHHGRVERTRAG
jgi:hypothetical protein